MKISECEKEKIKKRYNKKYQIFESKYIPSIEYR